MATTDTLKGKKAGYSLLKLVKRMFPFARRYVWQYVSAIILLALTSLLALLPPIIFKILIDKGVHAKDLRVLHWMAILLVGIAVSSGIVRGLMEYVHEWISARFITTLRSELLRQVFRQPMSFFNSTKTGDIIARLRMDTTALYGVLVNTFLGALSEVIQIIGTIIFMLLLNPILALLAVSFTVPLYVLVINSGRRIRKLSLEVRDKDVKLLDFFQEKINHIQTVKFFHREAFELQVHSDLSEDVIQTTLHRVRYKFIWVFLISVLTTLAGIFVIWYGGLKVIGGLLSFGVLFAFYLYTTKLYNPVQSLANRGVEIYNGLASAERIMEYLDLRSALVEAPNPVHLDAPQGLIEFRNVTFTYTGRSEPAVLDFNLEIAPCEKIALVGQSGAGKSTIVYLVSRLYDPDRGSILIDGHDLRNLSFDSLYRTIGVVSQETCLFNATIEENIRYGRPSASFDEIIDATSKVHLHEFIQGLPRGYQTNLGPRGLALSGGQRQRIALARMLLKGSRIWILDEFTSSLDSRSEIDVYQNIGPLLRDRTAIVIAHRLSTILSVDRIVVLQRGSIVESGSHAQLYRQSNLYKKLFDSQYAAVEKNGHANGIGGSIDQSLREDRFSLVAKGGRNGK